jgi:serine phosphatase RsbU (regulator of sigma subunit)
LEETTAAKERIESELRIARDIQMSMVPNIFPDRPGLDIYASMTPAKEVGGDLYGYLLLDKELYFCVGDVSGKGVPASLFMAQATRLFRTLATQHMMPAEIATRMNNALTEDNEQGMFVTMFIGLVYLDSGKLVFCNAGHNPPVLIAKKSETTDGSRNAEFIDVQSNAPIGLFPDIDYEGEQIDNIKGTPLFVYSDGLNEAENKSQEQFGDDQIINVLRFTPFENAKQVIEKMNELVEKHRNGAAPNDDLTMLCLSVKDPILN